MFTLLRTARTVTYRGGAGGLLARLAAAVASARATRRQRLNLARLDDRALDDIGLSRDEALAEAARPLWDVPRHWLR